MNEEEFLFLLGLLFVWVVILFACSAIYAILTGSGI